MEISNIMFPIKWDSICGKTLFQKCRSHCLTLSGFLVVGVTNTSTSFLISLAKKIQGLMVINFFRRKRVCCPINCPFSLIANIFPLQKNTESCSFTELELSLINLVDNSEVIFCVRSLFLLDTESRLCLPCSSLEEKKSEIKQRDYSSLSSCCSFVWAEYAWPAFSVNLKLTASPSGRSDLSLIFGG